MRLKSLLAPLLAASALAAAAAIPAAAHDAGDPSADDPSDTPCLAVDLRQHRRADPACADLPHFKASFLNRVWRFQGAVDSFQNTDDHVLSITLDGIDHLPKRFRNQDDDLLDQDMTVLMNENIRVFDPDGNLVPHDELEHADYVEVRGRLLRPRLWRANDDGEVVPTVRAKRIYIQSWVQAPDGPDAGDTGSDDPDCHPEPADEPAAELHAACFG